MLLGDAPWEEFEGRTALSRPGVEESPESVMAGQVGWDGTALGCLRDSEILCRKVPPGHCGVVAAEGRRGKRPGEGSRGRGGPGSFFFGVSVPESDSESPSSLTVCLSAFLSAGSSHLPEP